MRAPQTIIKRPLLTEKSTRLRETGGHDSAFGEPESAEDYAQKIVFEVAKDANKIEIRRAVEKLFNVQVSSVHTQIARGKKKRVGRYIGRRPARKKAIVTLQPGQTIEFFEGV
ncbi:MAG TPA: 50S ribosomal protein L23 [Kofleriaceae bacterium]|nr:50S ribosomal protein L23 [Kofleriaceae bacterium]